MASDQVVSAGDGERADIAEDGLTYFEAIYMGSERVALAQVPGAAEDFSDDFEVDFSDAALAVTLSRLSRQEAPDGKRDVVVPAVPSREICHRDRGAQSETPPPWPEPLASGPLMKVPAGSARELGSVAVGSGARSCLLRAANGAWYRLKGAGNREEGVVVRHNAPMSEEAGAWRDLRGVAWGHTARKELFWTRELERRLSPLGIVGANVSVGWYLYSAPNAPFGEGEMHRPACIVEAARGDRRLGTHVLAGLALLLPSLLRPSLPTPSSGGSDREADDAAAARVHTLLAQFPEARPPAEHATTAALASDHLLAKEYFWAGLCPDAHGLTWADFPRAASGFANAARSVGEAGGPGAALAPRAPSHEDPPPQQWTNDGPRDMDGTWRERWRLAVDDLRVALAAAPGGGEGALSYLYSRAGFECGRFLRALHATGVSWGTYQVNGTPG